MGVKREFRSSSLLNSYADFASRDVALPAGSIYSLGVPRSSKAIDSDAYNHAIAAEVRAAMALERVQQKQIADYFEWDRNYLGKRMLGQVPLGIPDLTKICEYLDVDMGDLLRRARQRAEQQRAQGEATAS